MHFPRQWGPVQIVLLLIAVFALVFIGSFVWSVFEGKKVQELEDEYGKKYYRRRHRHLRWQHGTTGVIVLVLAVVILLVTGAIQQYIGLTGKILVAHVSAKKVKTSGNIPMMSVSLTLYDDNGNKTSEDVYIVNGDEVFIGGDVIQLRGWMNILGFHSGYKVTKLEGMYSDVNLERTQQHTVVVLNGGDDDFFNTAYQNGWNTIFVTSAYKNGSSVPTNGIGYNICASQDAIVPQPDKEPC
jgi:hypothetical protein